MSTSSNIPKFHFEDVTQSKKDEMPGCKSSSSSDFLNCLDNAKNKSKKFNFWPAQKRTKQMNESDSSQNALKYQ